MSACWGILSLPAGFNDGVREVHHQDFEQGSRDVAAQLVEVRRNFMEKLSTVTDALDHKATSEDLQKLSVAMEGKANADTVATNADVSSVASLVEQKVETAEFESLRMWAHAAVESEKLVFEAHRASLEALRQRVDDGMVELNSQLAQLHMDIEKLDGVATPMARQLAHLVTTAADHATLEDVRRLEVLVVQKADAGTAAEKAELEHLRKLLVQKADADAVPTEAHLVKRALERLATSEQMQLLRASVETKADKEIAAAKEDLEVLQKHFDHGSRALIKQMESLAAELHLKATAEMVPTKEELSQIVESLARKTRTEKCLEKLEQLAANLETKADADALESLRHHYESAGNIVEQRFKEVFEQINDQRGAVDSMDTQVVKRLHARVDEGIHVFESQFESLKWDLEHKVDALAAQTKAGMASLTTGAALQDELRLTHQSSHNDVNALDNLWPEMCAWRQTVDTRLGRFQELFDEGRRSVGAQLQELSEELKQKPHAHAVTTRLELASAVETLGAKMEAEFGCLRALALRKADANAAVTREELKAVEHVVETVRRTLAGADVVPTEAHLVASALERLANSEQMQHLRVSVEARCDKEIAAAKEDLEVLRNHAVKNLDSLQTVMERKVETEVFESLQMWAHSAIESQKVVLEAHRASLEALRQRVDNGRSELSSQLAQLHMDIEKISGVATPMARELAHLVTTAEDKATLEDLRRLEVLVMQKADAGTAAEKAELEHLRKLLVQKADADVVPTEAHLVASALERLANSEQMQHLRVSVEARCDKEIAAAKEDLEVLRNHFDHGSRALIKQMESLAAELHLKATAEMVPTKEELSQIVDSLAHKTRTDECLEKLEQVAAKLETKADAEEAGDSQILGAGDGDHRKSSDTLFATGCGRRKCNFHSTVGIPP